MAKNEKTPLRRITLSGVVGKTPKPEQGQSIPLMRVYGIVEGYAKKPNRFDATRSYVQFTGSFEAVNLQNGEVYESSSLIMPDSDSPDVIAQGFDNAGKTGATSSKFAVDLSVVSSTKSPVGYTYVAKFVQKAGAHDALAELRDELPEVSVGARKRA